MCCGCFSIHNFTLIGTIIRNQAIHLQAEFTCLVNQPIQSLLAAVPRMFRLALDLYVRSICT